MGMGRGRRFADSVDGTFYGALIPDGKSDWRFEISNFRFEMSEQSIRHLPFDIR